MLKGGAAAAIAAIATALQGSAEVQGEAIWMSTHPLLLGNLQAIMHEVRGAGGSECSEQACRMCCQRDSSRACTHSRVLSVCAHPSPPIAAHETYIP